MIELTEEQVKALSKPHSNPPQLLNPRTNEAFVLLRAPRCFDYFDYCFCFVCPI